MRLLNTIINGDGTLQSKQFYASIPKYAILSHTWLADNAQELTLQEVLNGDGMSKQGYNKVISSINLARKDGHEWIWIDTCCIDKTSSVELSEAINSMFRYYAEAEICYAYLVDVDTEDAAFKLAKSRWFTRGWTLQELLAPSYIEFVSSEWQRLGSKHSHSAAISRITGIADEYLSGKSNIMHASIANRMFWASRRDVTRAEDMAYCLIGIFNVNMYMLYGEGAHKAFVRLQEEILKVSDDHSIFAWTKPAGSGDAPHGFLADSPEDFERAAKIVPYTNDLENTIPPTLTSRGLHISLPLRSKELEDIVATLNCPDPDRNYQYYLAVYLRQTGPQSSYTRIRCTELLSQPHWNYPKPLFISQHIPVTRPRRVYPRHVCKLGSVRIRHGPSKGPDASVPPVERSTDGTDGFEHSRSSSTKSYGLDRSFLDLSREHDNLLGDYNVTKDHNVTKKAGMLSMVLPFRRAIDGHKFVLLVGSMTDFEIGFDVSFDVSFIDPPKKLKGWSTREWKAFWQPWFQPKPTDTPLPVENPILYVTADEQVRDGDTLHFLIDVWIDRPPALQSKDDVAVRSKAIEDSL